MKKQVVGYMAIGMLAMAVMVQAQPASRPGRNLNPRDSSERVSPMMRMNGPRTGIVRPGQFGQRDSVRGRAPMRSMEPSRGMQGGMRQMPQNRAGVAPFGSRPTQRGGALGAPGSNRMQGGFAAPGNRGMQRGGIAPGSGYSQRGAVAPGSRNFQRGAVAPGNRGMQRGGNTPGFGPRMGQPGMQQGMRLGMQRGMGQGMQVSRSVNPEERIKQEVDQLKKSLDLTDNQVKKITAIKEKQAKKEIKAYKKAQKKAADKRKKIQAPNDKIKSVLTDEQIKKWESTRQGATSSARPGVGFGGNRFQR